MGSEMWIVLNGKRRVISDADPSDSLLSWLHSEELFGTHNGAEEGYAGWSVVLVSKFDAVRGGIVHRAVDSALFPIALSVGCSITTVEGLADPKTGPHEIQTYIAQNKGVQCGWCTPGFVISMMAMLYECHSTPETQKKITSADIEDGLDGIVCRCTGYRGQLETARYLAEHVDSLRPAAVLRDVEDCQVDESKDMLTLSGPKSTWYFPLTVEKALKLREELPKSVLVNGAIGFMLDRQMPKPSPEVIVSLLRIRSLETISLDEKGLQIGGGVTLSQLRTFLKDVKELPGPFESFLKLVGQIGPRAVRNVGSVVGNLFLKAPRCDLMAAFLALDAHFEVVGAAKRIVPIDEIDSVEAGEIVSSIFIPAPAKDTFAFCEKVARRKQNARSIVTIFFVATFEKRKEIPFVQACRLAYTGMSSRPSRCIIAEKELLGKAWSTEHCDTVCSMLSDVRHFKSVVASFDGSVAYKCLLACNLFRRAFVTMSMQLRDIAGFGGVLSVEKDEEVSVEPSAWSVPTTVRHFEARKSSKEWEVVGSAAQDEALMRCGTGDMLYTATESLPKGVLHGVFVCSTVAHAKFSTDVSALAEMNVRWVDVSSLEALGGKNLLTGLYEDCPVFYKDVVSHVGAPIGLVCAESLALAQKGAEAVKVTYSPLPAILSVDQAIEEDSYFYKDHILEMGDLAQAEATSDKVISGEVVLGGQDHFYGETNNTLVVPREDELVFYCATQNPSKIQADCARAVNLPHHRVVVITRRMGGGFGGKQDRPSIVATAAGVAARVLKRPIRVQLDRRTDMEITGGRHPMRVRYRVGVKPDGTLQSWDVVMYADGGSCMDISYAVVDKALFQVGGVYKQDTFRSAGHVMKTNRVTNTAFRGFGAPQATNVVETIIEHVGRELGLEQWEIREKNLWKAGDAVPVGCFVDAGKGEARPAEMFARMMVETRFMERIEGVKEFNATHKFQKRGIAIVPNKNAVCFEADFMNQAGALVHCYTDGTVQVNHSGVEMGQSINLKMAQIAAEELQVPLAAIYVTETRTDKVPNSQPTAASSGTDLNGPCVLEACRMIAERLKPYREADPSKSFASICTNAYFDRVNLSASAHTSLPKFGWSWESRKGAQGFYYNYGVAVSEVEIDVLTGHFTVLSCDCLQDAGNSLNPGIDCGQVEGGYMQGLGYLTMEDVVWDFTTGMQLTATEEKYAIPTIVDAPLSFTSRIMSNASCEPNIKGSKATGEGPMMLANATALAIKEAVMAVRKEKGLGSQYHRMDFPYTSERIAMACSGKAPERST